MKSSDYYADMTFDMGPWDIVRYEQTKSHLLQFGSLLDVGSGSGFFANCLDTRTQREVTGVDVSESRVQALNEKYEYISFVQADATNLPFEDNSFDEVIALEVIEHIPDWKKAFDELIRVSNQQVIITIPYKERIVKANCPKCYEQTPLYGHLHSFDEFDFSSIGKRVSFDYIHLDDVATHVKRLFGKQNLPLKTGGVKSGSSYQMKCIECLHPFEKELPYQTKIRRLEKLLLNRPEWLLVKIDTSL